MKLIIPADLTDPHTEDDQQVWVLAKILDYHGRDSQGNEVAVVEIPDAEEITDYPA